MKTQGRTSTTSVSMMATEHKGSPEGLSQPRSLAPAEPALTHLLAFIYPLLRGHLKPRQQADGPALESFVIPNCAVMWTSPFVPCEALLCLIPCILPERCILRLLRWFRWTLTLSFSVKLRVWPFLIHSVPAPLPGLQSNAQDSQSWHTPAHQSCQTFHLVPY